MMLRGELVLPADVEMVSVRDLTSDLRTKLNAADDDYALTRVRSRTPSRIVDEGTAALLALFRSPTRVVDAILSFANTRGVDPEATLEQIYPLLVRLVDAKLLVAANSADSNPITSKLTVGTVVGGFTLLRSVQVLEDTEVFLSQDAHGVYAAVKFCRRRDEAVARQVAHEAEIMRQVGAGRAPEVFSLIQCDEGIALISEWIFGVDVANAAAGLRGRREPRSEKHLLSLCVEVAQAFSDVHASGVLHGDVHPRNILVEPAGSVRLIDFGFSRVLEPTDAHEARGGVAFYMDPESARAQRQRSTAPLTGQGEQYSVASLLYHLWTGAHYVDWNLERNEMLRQIVEERPAPFQARGVSAWPQLEQTLHRAFQKRPERRYENMSLFGEALRGLLPKAAARDRLANVHAKERARENDFITRSLSRYDFGGPGLLEPPANTPVASINYGAAGIAYAIYRIAQRRGSPHLLALADVWAQRAYKLSSHPRAFHDARLGIDPAIVGEVSLFHSPSGLHCVRALVSVALGDVDGANRAIHSFINHSRRPCANSDLTLGRASLLLAFSELAEALPAPSQFDLSPAITRGNEIATELVSLLHSDSIASAQSIPSLGIAHGWGGFIFSLLRWAKATKTSPPGIVAEKLSELAALAEPHAGGMRWPVHNRTRSPAFMEGWCNGTAGHVLLFALAHDVLGTEAFADLAERGAESTWATEMHLGTLCCGLAGIGYAFAAAHRLTGNDVWLHRADAMARRAAADTSEQFFLDALYKGAVGAVMLAEDLKQPMSTSMPLFEPTS